MACHVISWHDTSIRNMTRHVKDVHNKTRDHKCKLCGLDFAQEWRLDRHVETVHQSIKGYYMCELCPAGFNYISGLSSHMKTAHKRNLDGEVKSKEADKSIKVDDGQNPSTTDNFVFVACKVKQESPDDSDHSQEQSQKYENTGEVNMDIIKHEIEID